MKASRSCPKCGSGNVRVSRERGLGEWLKSLIGIQHVRCRGCGYRFTDYPWRKHYLLYAHCPKCANMKLKDWHERYHWPPAYKRALLLVGAQQHRCEHCRYNFVSFRRRWKAPKKKGSK